MKKLIVILGIFLQTSFAAAESIDYESVTVADTAIGITTSKISPTNSEKAKRLFCTLETAQVRFRADGTNPTSAEGHLLNVGDTLALNNTGDIGRLRAIRTGDTSGVLKCTFER